MPSAAVECPTPTPADVSLVAALWPWHNATSVHHALEEILRTTPADCCVVMPPGSAPADLAEKDRLRVIELPNDDETSCGAFLNRASAIHSRADLVMVADAVAQLPSDWLDKLRSTVESDDTLAAATTLTHGGAETPLGLPANDLSEVRAAAPSPAHPRVVAPWPHLTWLRRSALDLVGPFAPLNHPAVALADFAARALSHGLSCVVADEMTLTVTPGGLEPCPPETWAQLWQRHPWLESVSMDQAALGTGPLRRSLVAARAAALGVSVTVDARALGPGVGGTQTYTAALVLALARSERVAVRAVMAHDAPADVCSAFADVGVEVVGYEEAVAGIPLTDIVHRPQQVFTPDDLGLLRLLGERIVISHMDLIAFRTPTYHGSIDAWRAYRRTTRLALAAADRILFFSDHARRDAIGEELVTPERAGVAGIGIDVPADISGAQRPLAVPTDREFLLALGADYAHKNRPFALAVVDELRRRHGWDGVLVLAGSHVAHGSSAAEERRLLAERPELDPAVIDLGRVSEAEKRWLLAAATAHICASAYEGFGLAPLEAAAAGRPCVYAARTSLAETIDPGAATLVAWDAASSAERAIELLTAGEARDRHLKLLENAVGRFIWDAVVAQIVAGYEQALAAPYRGASRRAWEELEREQLIVDLDAARDDLEARFAHGRQLVDLQQPLLTRAQRRGLMRVASRTWLRGPLLGAFGLLGADDRDADGR